jgi:hypothetical protein
MPDDHRSEDMYVDANGCLTEVVALGGQEVAVHYDAIPESDITTVRGLRCTTPLRTVIDIAPETSEPEPRQRFVGSEQPTVKAVSDDSREL